MTQTTDKYKNVSFDELIEFSKHNPNRNQTLSSIEIKQVKQSEDTSLDKIGLRGYRAFNLNPSGIVSLIACVKDSGSYMISSKSARLQSISNLTTELQEKTDNLKNSHLARKRKKVYDLIGATYNNARLEDKDHLELYSGVSYIMDMQFILMKSSVQEVSETGEVKETGYKGEIYFSSDPSSWKYDNPVWIADFHSRWVAIPLDSTSKPIKTYLANWVSTMEQTGWFIHWPDVDGTKTELIEKLSVLPTWSETDKSLKKDTLSQRLGKANTIKLFTNWMMGKIDSLEESD